MRRERTWQRAAAPAAMADLSSDDLLEYVAWKKQITQAKKLFETTNQAPSPSKDYVHVLVTERGVVLRRFPITLRGVSQGAVPSPTEKIVTLEEFQLDTELQGEISRIFGPETLNQVRRGHRIYIILSLLYFRLRRVQAVTGTFFYCLTKSWWSVL